ncbi:Uncharacterized protein BP5553_02861 [Venustampulla echinocandica]|uniref:CCAAT-binding factor domain-containing protein n=1 Tax=Venustampulla echinocandica TaxID=2656787 RepID=A0A370TSL5_9HELO|nr:Uncharacterized protein BP5553_02861 [Venustampulla echinocandica]RDL38521.1 Uncharacterized protein BP5553_02861 [Venustampulla echinocandica]
MPAAAADTGRAVKRKRSTSEKRSSKRPRSESSEEDGQAQILLLENEIFESKKNYNNIAKLIKIFTADNEDADDSVLAAISLCRVFTRLTTAGALVSKPGASEKETVVVNWLRDRYAEYKTGLLDILGEEGISATALTLCMRLLKTEGESVVGNNDYYRFPTAFLTGITKALLNPDCDFNVRKEFSEKYVEEYDDVRFYTLEAIQTVLEDSATQSSGQLFDNVLEILTSIESVPESKDELEDFYVPAPKKTGHALYSLMKHKKRAQGAWLGLMKMNMDKDQRKKILGLVSSTIAPWFMQPELLMDFLTDCYDAGGSSSLLALSGVFYLMQEKNLDYPAFYRKLYSLLDSDILHSKHRSRFLRLLDTFLASTHLPVVLVASFIKRLSRLALSAPPAGIVVVIPWVYNLLKKHPTCTFMIHRETRTAEERELLENAGMSDPFLMEEQDPMETNAIKSSLWEIVTLQSHYHPNVATIAKIISEQFTKHRYNLEDFLDHSYGSMLEAELAKDIKKVPVIEYEIPKKIFMKQDVASGVEDSLLVKLWDFS